MTTDRRLTRGIISSSSGRDLIDLFREIHTIAGDDVAFDLFMLRDSDVRQIEKAKGTLVPNWDASTSPIDQRTFTALMAQPDNAAKISEWFCEQCRTGKVTVSALATYFPEITSLIDARRLEAIMALTQSVVVALRLADAGFMTKTGAVVEFVCGTILDPCECAACQPRGETFLSSDKEKIERLVSSLESVVKHVRRMQSNNKAPAGPFALAAELEPGDTYVLRDERTLTLFLKLLDKKEELHKHVGLNLDVAHMRIANVQPKYLKGHLHRIAHSHIADHPGMHTRDQVVGTWTPVDRRRNGYSAYIDLLKERLTNPTESAVGFSGVIALELEGCNRLAWACESLRSIRQLIETSYNSIRR